MSTRKPLYRLADPKTGTAIFFPEIRQGRHLSYDPPLSEDLMCTRLWTPRRVQCGVALEPYRWVQERGIAGNTRSCSNGQAGIHSNATRDRGGTGPCQCSQRNLHFETLDAKVTSDSPLNPSILSSIVYVHLSVRGWFLYHLGPKRFQRSPPDFDGKVQLSHKVRPRVPVMSTGRVSMRRVPEDILGVLGISTLDLEQVGAGDVHASISTPLDLRQRFWGRGPAFLKPMKAYMYVFVELTSIAYTSSPMTEATDTILSPFFLQ
ncbi:uncharacterized protein BT62DRAFT_1011088 [Guyanagaster necrorhizus]|uniref:Uncharacterized protein n=1 Tax=Guyanagaster necrorhizus TaxID=856835 RepID=A0A9P7VK37_9AGAR|nr:uncharacterized protein BT62DRAFT_1011088 [Guyanagaster necrorhizus MCA 3950]KAG7441795.1 hypothetical protein BT62DRAFT_1011088 [Guyanagaster necrorhizus MCA 3950]